MFGEVAANVLACGAVSIPASKGVWHHLKGKDKSNRLSTEKSLPIFHA